MPIKLFINILALLILLSLPVHCRAGSWAAVSRNASRLKSVQAEFTQETHLKILTRPIISKGIFIFQAPNSLRWEYKSPIRSIMLMHDGRIRKYIQQDGRLVKEHGAGLASMQIVLQEITHWLKGQFNSDSTFKVKLEKDNRIIFTPRNKAIARLINRIVLKLSDQPSLMDSVTIYEGPASFTRLTFTKAKINQTVKASLFTDK
ncbi:outer membrane lipoprotein carrier protein LolA [Desulfobacterota bacterium M19]